MSKIAVTSGMLRALYTHALSAGTLGNWCDVAMDWADAAATGITDLESKLALAEAERDAALAEVTRLREIFDRAPHLFGCAGWNGISWSMRECDCWKHDALAPRDTATGLQAGTEHLGGE